MAFVLHLDALHAHIDCHKGDEALGQQLPDDLPDAPKPGNNDVAPQLLCLSLCSLQRLNSPFSWSIPT